MVITYICHCSGSRATVPLLFYTILYIYIYAFCLHPCGKLGKYIILWSDYGIMVRNLSMTKMITNVFENAKIYYIEIIIILPNKSSNFARCQSTHHICILCCVSLYLVCWHTMEAYMLVACGYIFKKHYIFNGMEYNISVMQTNLLVLTELCWSFKLI